MSSIATSRLKADEEAGLLAAIIRSSEDAIISKSLDGCITSWNSAAERLFGYSAAEAVGQPISMLFSHGGMPEERRLVAQIERGIAVEHSKLSGGPRTAG